MKRLTEKNQLLASRKRNVESDKYLKTENRLVYQLLESKNKNLEF